jgi:hypothetical protein
VFKAIRQRWLTGKVYMYMSLVRYDNDSLKHYTDNFQKHYATLEKTLNELSEITVEESLA